MYQIVISNAMCRTLSCKLLSICKYLYYLDVFGKSVFALPCVTHDSDNMMSDKIDGRVCFRHMGIYIWNVANCEMIAKRITQLPLNTIPSCLNTYIYITECIFRFVRWLRAYVYLHLLSCLKV